MKSASPDITILFGIGSPQFDITDMVTSPVPLSDRGIAVDTTTYGATATVKSPVGMSDPPDVPLSMLFDDKDGGSMDLFQTISGPNTNDYVLQVIWTTGSPVSSSTWPCAIAEFTIAPAVKDFTRVNVVLTSRGPIVHSRAGA